MKQLLSMLAVVLTLGLGAVHFDAEAKRIGSGRSLGMQRQATPPAKAPNATPSTAPAAGAAAGAAPKRNWMGPIAGLAAGLGLAALASHLGFGEGFANLLMIGLLAVAAVALFRMFSRRQAAARSDGMAYAGAGTDAQRGQNSFRTHQDSQQGQGHAGGGSMIGANLQPAAARFPAGFDATGFARNAQVQFIRLQAANDAGNLEDLREFTTPEMLAELQMDIRDRQGAVQQTRVLDLEADVVEVVEEGSRYIASVRFTGHVQEDGAAPEAIDEIWHLTKPVTGSGGWVLAGIQQGN